MLLLFFSYEYTTLFLDLLLLVNPTYLLLSSTYFIRGNNYYLTGVNKFDLVLIIP